MTKLQEIRTEIWLNRYYEGQSMGFNMAMSCDGADKLLKEFDSRFPGEPTNPIPTNEKPIRLNGGCGLSILEAEMALESASGIINHVVSVVMHPSALVDSATKWLQTYCPERD